MPSASHVSAPHVVIPAAACAAADDTPFAAIEVEGAAVIMARMRGGDPQCLVPVSGKLQCHQLSSPAEAQDLLPAGGRRLLVPLTAWRTLTCGSEMLRLLGRTGYEESGGWCSRAKAVLLTRERCCAAPVLL